MPQVPDRIPENLPIHVRPDAKSRDLQEKVESARLFAKIMLGLSALDAAGLVTSGIPAAVGIITKHPEWGDTAFAALDAIAVPIGLVMVRRAANKVARYREQLDQHVILRQAQAFLRLSPEKQQKLISVANKDIARYTLFRLFDTESVPFTDILDFMLKHDLTFDPEAKPDENRLHSPINPLDAVITQEVLREVEDTGNLSQSEIDTVKGLRRELQNRFPNLKLLE